MSGLDGSPKVIQYPYITHKTKGLDESQLSLRGGRILKAKFTSHHSCCREKNRFGLKNTDNTLNAPNHHI